MFVTQVILLPNWHFSYSHCIIAALSFSVSVLDIDGKEHYRMYVACGAISNLFALKAKGFKEHDKVPTKVAPIFQWFSGFYLHIRSLLVNKTRCLLKLNSQSSVLVSVLPTFT